MVKPKTAEEFVIRKVSAKRLFTKELEARWHPTVGSQIVALKEINNGYDTREEAIEAGEEFKKHCRRILGETN